MIINYSDQEVVKEKKSIFLAGQLLEKKMLFLRERKHVKF